MFTCMVRIYLFNVPLYGEGILVQCSSVWWGYTCSLFVCMVRVYLFNVRMYGEGIHVQCSPVW